MESKAGDPRREALSKWLRRRKASLEDARAPHEAKWKDIRLYFDPSLGRALLRHTDPNRAAAPRDDDKLVNSYPRQLMRRLSAGLQSGITNPAREWFKLSGRSTASREREGRNYLDRATETLQSVISASNVYPALALMYCQLAAFGTACALLVPDEESVLRLIVLDCGAYWIAENRRGSVDVLLRRSAYTVEQVVLEYGLEVLPDRIKTKWDHGRLDEYVTVWNYIAPIESMPENVRPLLEGTNDDGARFVSVHWMDDKAGDGILAVRRFFYNPIICPRWTLSQGGPYGTGVGEHALGDLKQLQMLEIAKLKIVEQEVDPAMIAPETMKGMPIDTGPGGISYYKELLGQGGMGGNIPVQRLFETRESLEAVLRAIEDLRIRLDQECYADLFAMMLNLDQRQGSREMTAAEVNELASEKVSLLGPILTQLNTDLLDPLVNGVFMICYDKAQEEMALTGEDASGLASPPSSLLDTEFEVEYQSSIHVAQQSTTRLAGFIQLQQFVGSWMQIDSQCADALDIDGIIQTAAETMHEYGCVRSKKEIDEVRGGRAAAQEQQMRLAQQQQRIDSAKAQSEIARNLAQAKVAQGATAFDAVPGVAM